MIASVIIPSRGHFDELLVAVNSCLCTANDRDEIEVIVRFDHDDYESLDRIHELLDLKQVRVIIGSRGEGFIAMHEFANECAKLSRGDWIICLNDDAQIITPNWDLELTKLDASVPTVINPVIDWPVDHELEAYQDFAKRPRVDFPMISRSLYQKLEIFSPSPVYDWFWDDLVRSVPALGGKIGYFTVNHNYRPHISDFESNNRKVRIHQSEKVQVQIKSCIHKLL